MEDAMVEVFIQMVGRFGSSKAQVLTGHETAEETATTAAKSVNASANLVQKIVPMSMYQMHAGSFLT